MCVWPLFILLAMMSPGEYGALMASEKPRVIVTSDGEIDDECSMVRFMLYTNEWDVEAIVTSSSQYHWQGHSWAGDDWIDPYLDAYAQVYPNLIKARQRLSDTCIPAGQDCPLAMSSPKATWPNRRRDRT